MRYTLRFNVLQILTLWLCPNPPKGDFGPYPRVKPTKVVLKDLRICVLQFGICFEFRISFQFLSLRYSIFDIRYFFII
jgi:hypothetical protein